MHEWVDANILDKSNLIPPSSSCTSGVHTIMSVIAKCDTVLKQISMEEVSFFRLMGDQVPTRCRNLAVEMLRLMYRLKRSEDQFYTIRYEMR
jgi:hypothetical protein